MGSWEPINFRTVDSGTHQFSKGATKMYPNFSVKWAENLGWELRVAFGNPSIWIPNGASDFGKEDMAEGFFSFFPPFTNLVGRGHKLCGFTNHQCPTATNEFTSKSPLDKKAEELCWAFDRQI